MSIALTLALLAAQNDPLEKNWKQLQEAWHAAAQAKADEDYVADKFLQAAAKVFMAFEGAGLNAKDLPADRAAIKRALKARLVPAVQARMPRPKEEGRSDDRDEMRRLVEEAMRQMEDVIPGKKRASAGELLDVIRTRAKEAAAAKDSERATHEEKVAGALEGLVVIEKGAPPWLKRRVTRLVIALETRGDYPAPAAAGPELRAKVARLIEQLGDDDIGRREKATAELVEIGEAALPQLREAGRSDNPEVRLRARTILGEKE